MTAGAQPHTLADALMTACHRWPERAALVSRRGTLTYGSLGAAAERLAVAYGVLGVEPGDRVLCSVANRAEALIAPLAAWLRGALHVAADYQATAAELIDLSRRTSPRVLVYSPPPGSDDVAATLDAVRVACPGIELIVAGADPDLSGIRRFEQLTRGEGEPVHDCAPDATDAAIIFVSSGTTGTPKTTLGFHGNLAQRWTRLGAWLGFGPDDVHLAQLPLSHGFGMMMAVAGLLTGGRLVLLERFEVSEALAAIEHERITVLNGAPTHFRLLLDRLGATPRAVDSLRFAVGTAAPFDAPLVQQIWDRLGVRFMVMYGSSEGVGFATSDRDDIVRGAVGRAAPGSVMVIDSEQRPLEPGEVGELCFSRRVFPVRLWGQNEPTQEWFRSGDIGRVDTDGRLYVYGRLKQQIDRGGLKVDPVEVEAALLGSPRVADAAVIGRADAILGEVVCACIVPAGEEPQPRLGELRELMGRSLAPHKLPDELRTLRTIPRTPLGKVDLAQLGADLDARPHLVERRRPAARVSP